MMYFFSVFDPSPSKEQRAATVQCPRTKSRPSSVLFG